MLGLLLALSFDFLFLCFTREKVVFTPVLVSSTHRLDEVIDHRVRAVDPLESLGEREQRTGLLWTDFPRAGSPTNQIIHQRQRRWAPCSDHEDKPTEKSFFRPLEHFNLD